MLNLKDDSVVVDCTLGSGGHASLILNILKEKGTYIGVDVDQSALEANTDLKTRASARVIFVHDNFRNIREFLKKEGIGKADAILADLGWRIEQFESTQGEPKGFSFKNDEPLLMTFGESGAYPFTAHEIINDWKEEDIANVIYAYGQERFSRRIARRIVEARKVQPIVTSLQLSAIVKEAVPPLYGRKKIHPATKTFQALRIAVNDEFDALRDLLLDGFECLAPGGRMAIITFHSLEDRIVKETFRTFVRDQKGILVHKKPIEASKEELSANPRARSAKLRTIEKI